MNALPENSRQIKRMTAGARPEAENYRWLVFFPETQSMVFSDPVACSSIAL